MKKFIIIFYLFIFLFSCQNKKVNQFENIPKPIIELAIKYPFPYTSNYSNKVAYLLWNSMNTTIEIDPYEAAHSLEKTYLSILDLLEQVTGVRQDSISIINVAGYIEMLFSINSQKYKGLSYRDYAECYLIAFKKTIKDELSEGTVFLNKNFNSVPSLGHNAFFDARNKIEIKAAMYLFVKSLSEKQKLYLEENSLLFLESLSDEQAKLYRKFGNEFRK